MPLTTCPDCHREISDRSAVCIHCGAPLQSAAGTVQPPGGAVGQAAPLPPPETDLWSGHPSHWSAVGFYTLCVLFIWLVVPLALLVWKYLEIRTTTYIITSQRLRIRTGILSRTTEEIELFRVKDTSLVEPFWLRMVGLGNVDVVEADASAPTITLGAIAQAEQVRETLRAQVMAVRSTRRTITMEGI